MPAWRWGCAAALLAIFALQLGTSVLQQSQTADEAVHLYAGYQYWRNRDFGANPEHPPLVKLLAALPLLRLDLNPLPAPAANPYPGAERPTMDFLYRNRAAPQQMLNPARLVLMVFPVLLGVLLFLAGCELFGPNAGLIALGLFAFEPNLLANGALVATDVAVTCFLFASVYAVYRYLQAPSAPRLLLSGIAVGLTFASKHSGILVLPTLLALLLFTLPWRARKQLPAELLRRSAAFAAICAVMLLMVWAFYTFRYAARPPGALLDPSIESLLQPLRSGTQREVLRLLLWSHLLPESYVSGLAQVLQGSQGRVMFLLDTVYETGRWFFFPIVFPMKTTVAFLILAIGGLGLLRKAELRPRLVFVLLPAIIFFGAAMTSRLNLGVRHVLPAFPYLLLIAGAGASWAIEQRAKLAALAAALLLAHAGSSLAYYPNYLTYTNEVARAYAPPYRLMSDANLDWGQGLLQTGDYLKRHGITDCWMAYREFRLPLASYGIPCRVLPGSALDLAEPGPLPQKLSGTVLLSAFEASGQTWGPGDLNPYRFFLQRTPDDVIAGSILVFHGEFDIATLRALQQAGDARRALDAGHPELALQISRAAAALAPGLAEMPAWSCLALRALHRELDAEPVCAQALQLAESTYPDFYFTRIPALQLVGRQ